MDCTLVALDVSLIFDITWFKIEQEREVEKSWQKLNDKLKREGRTRLNNKTKRKKISENRLLYSLKLALILREKQMNSKCYCK